jgi:hypothetical protein
MHTYCRPLVGWRTPKLFAKLKWKFEMKITEKQGVGDTLLGL